MSLRPPFIASSFSKAPGDNRPDKEFSEWSETPFVTKYIIAEDLLYKHSDSLGKKRYIELNKNQLKDKLVSWSRQSNEKEEPFRFHLYELLPKHVPKKFYMEFAVDMLLDQVHLLDSVSNLCIILLIRTLERVWPFLTNEEWNIDKDILIFSNDKVSRETVNNERVFHVILPNLTFVEPSFGLFIHNYIMNKMCDDYIPFIVRDHFNPSIYKANSLFVLPYSSIRESDPDKELRIFKPIYGPFSSNNIPPYEDIQQYKELTSKEDYYEPFIEGFSYEIKKRFEKEDFPSLEDYYEWFIEEYLIVTDKLLHSHELTVLYEMSNYYHRSS